MKSEISIKIGGPAGAGVKSVGSILAKTLLKLGYKVFEYPEYPSLIRGGHNTELIHASRQSAFSQVKPVDVLLALDENTLKQDLAQLKDGGAVIFDSRAGQSGLNTDIRFKWFDVPMSKIATANGNSLAANIAGLGAGLKIIGVPLKVGEEIIVQEFGGKSDQVIQSNLKSLKSGFDYLSSSLYSISGPDKNRISSSDVLISGNEAIGLGAIAAGLGLYAAYPMTPSTSILHFLAQHQAEFGFVVKQPEDEISAVNMVVGAMHMGVRAMCATSGGGFALMNETLALAGMTETPLVIVLGQRPGPATGLPTWTEQGELKYAIHAGHGEFLKFVLAPGDTLEAFRMTVDAFNLAERYQTPVIILTDKFLGESSMTTPNLDSLEVVIDRGEVIDEKRLKKLSNFQRYQLTDSGISLRSLPGFAGGVFCANSDEHEYHGLVDESAQMRVWQNEKRLQKMDQAIKNIPGPELIGPESAKTTLITWGSSKLPALQALSLAKQEMINILHFSYIWPFPISSTKQSLSSLKSQRTLVIESNATGQFQALLKEQVGFEPSAYFRKYDGRPFYPEEIIEKIVEL